MKTDYKEEIKKVKAMSWDEFLEYADKLQTYIELVSDDYGKFLNDWGEDAKMTQALKNELEELRKLQNVVNTAWGNK